MEIHTASTNQLYGAEYKCNGCKGKAIAKAVLSQESWWGQDLTKVEGLEDAVAENLTKIFNDGMVAAIRSL